MAHPARTIAQRSSATPISRTIALAGVGLGALLLGEVIARALGLRVAPLPFALGALAAALGASLLVAAFAIRWLRAERPIPARGIAWDQLTPTAFEREVARLFARAGYRVQLTGAAGDGGVDVRVWPVGRRTAPPCIVQCKRYAAGRAVGPATIRELIGARAHERAGAAWLATTGRLTAGARQLAVAEGIVVLDTAALATWDTALR